jgi:lysophospholipase L1-like esterase
MSRFLQRGSRIFLVIAGLGTGVMVAELLLHLLPAAPVAKLRGLHELRPDRPWVYGLRPGAHGRLPASGDVGYAINADGFRDRRYRRPKPAGVYRIIVIGDSIAFGYGVEEADTFPKVLEARLAMLNPSLTVEVMNLGVGGYNPYTEAALLADVGIAYEPDLVLVQFCVNDLYDPTFHFDQQTRLHLGTLPDAAFPNPARRRQPPSALTATAVALCHRSRLCTLADETLLAWHSVHRDLAAERAVLRPHDGDESAPEWSWLSARYSEMARTAATHRAHFAIIIFPFQTQVTGTATAAIQQRIAALGRKAGWATIDLLPAFHEAANDPVPLFLDAWHPTARGHRVAADAILADLSCRGWLPEAQPSLCTSESGS